ncbi:MBL fold metallo-hydrolase [Gilvibacter sp.]|uniref:MBL fold metallo-hydrolase n=1 Tax=Gilvibacter sp. TaxID=2729997 RepID=UPI0025C2E55C|nr:MBL fold metallo-hydrolase [Gilvibacter sp.]NQX77237.1 MBL fold metallo-hydrolase [Gilvibacter sp.]
MRSPLKITFLGTGTSQGIPIIGSTHPVCLSEDPKDKRLRVSVQLQWDDQYFVIDCGPDFRQQMLRVGQRQLDGILLTHEHSDHTAGLDDIRPFFFRQGDVPFYAEPRVFDALKDRFGYIFETENKYPGAPTIAEHVIQSDTSFDLKGKRVTPIRVFHGDLPVLGFRIDDFAYMTDVKTIPDAEFEKLRGLDVVVISALRVEPHRTHLNLEEALAMAARIGAKKTYFTHISHLLGFHEEVSKNLPENVYLAYDKLELNFN